MLQTAPQNPILHLAFELASKKWLLGFTDGRPQIRKIEVKAGDLSALLGAIAATKVKFGLPKTCRVVSCYEAGRDGFWLHRALVAQGIENRVLDSASLETNRRSRRAKTDRIDVEKMARMSVREASGEKNVWRVVNVPPEDVEDVRNLFREASDLTVEMTQQSNRIWGIWPGRAWPARSEKCLIGACRNCAGPTAEHWDRSCSNGCCANGSA